jgi:PAS domain S-box-containing protein
MKNMISENTTLQIENNELAYIIQNSLNEIYIFDINSLKFIYANKGALLNTGYTLLELSQLTPLDIKPEFTAEKFKELLEPLENKEKEIILFTTIHKRKNNTSYPVEVHLQKMKYKNADVYTAIIIDISEQVEFENKLIEATKTLVDINEQLHHFAATTAHDLQEPLRMVSTFSGLLENNCSSKLDGKGLQYLHYILDGSKRMKLLIDEILEYSQIDRSSIKIESIDINQILSLVLTDLNERINESNAIIKLPEETTKINGNFTCLYRLFLNMINNSIKYSKVDENPQIQIDIKSNPNFWVITIQDNGIGISSEYFDNIFDMYVRLPNENDVKGTGIGLAICKKVVELHEGNIWVESQEGIGSKFTFTLKK